MLKWIVTVTVLVLISFNLINPLPIRQAETNAPPQTEKRKAFDGIIENGRRIYVHTTGELASKCVQLTGFESAEEGVGCSFICTVEGFGPDYYVIKGSNIFPNYGQRLNKNDSRRLITITAKVKMQDLLAPSGGSTNDGRPLALQREIANMPIVHLAEIDSAELCAWAATEDSTSPKTLDAKNN